MGQFKKLPGRRLQINTNHCLIVMPAEGVSPRAGTQGAIHPWVPDISLTRNSGMTANTSERNLP